MHLVGQRAGHPFELKRVDRETFLPAMIASFLGKNAPLRAELQKLLQ
jgi:cell filamentation protein